MGEGIEAMGFLMLLSFFSMSRECGLEREGMEEKCKEIHEYIREKFRRCEG